MALAHHQQVALAGSPRFGSARPGSEEEEREEEEEEVEEAKRVLIISAATVTSVSAPRARQLILTALWCVSVTH